MTAREYLNRAYRVNEMIESNLRQVERLNDMATNVTSGFDERVQSSPNGDRTARIIEKIIMLKAKINDDTDRLVDLLAENKAAIDKVSDADERLLLTLRYVEFMKWENICGIMNLSERRAMQIHGKALIHVDISERVQ
ncbi:MAG: DUF1492 domain-containing protein [Faecalibacterium sp.]|nr:DUF1492 domain-containing protein [Ruminococcus sp.]MCM1392273.1 DUF1492 domain-containing protein [Ruminococcus sp.]MCM1485939.1 DUF1492 domain-containing protein [Faecalibacterium sp.]